MKAEDFSSLIREVDAHARTELNAVKPNISSFTTLDDLPIENREWKELDGVTAVFADLIGSSRFSEHKHIGSTAAIYQAATTNVVKIYDSFGADYLQIQGDGVFALFWGHNAQARAICAAITIQTFSSKTIEKVLTEEKLKFKTGYKIGLSHGKLLVKKIGIPRRKDRQEKVWAGRTLNYAVKAAQSAPDASIIVTSTLRSFIEKSKFLSYSCGHESNDPTLTLEPSKLWEDFYIDKLNKRPEAEGLRLGASWCAECGPAFVENILIGKIARPGFD